MTRPFVAGGTASRTGAAPSAPATAPEAPVWRRVALGAAWVAILVAVLVLLDRLGSGRLSTPPLLDRAALQDWLDERDAVTVAFALVRLVGMVLAAYLLVVTVVGLLARATRIPALVRVADLATIPAVRRVLGTVAGVGLTASAASLVAASMLPDEGPRTAPGAELVDTRVVLERLPDSGDTVLRRLPDQGDDGTSTLRVDDSTGGEEPPAEHLWVAEPGDHLWHVAEATLAAEWGRPPTDAEVAPYWTAVVEANRGVLADPSNPDLIHPGQAFTLPPPPPPPQAPPPAGG